MKRVRIIQQIVTHPGETAEAALLRALCDGSAVLVRADSDEVLPNVSLRSCSDVSLKGYAAS